MSRRNDRPFAAIRPASGDDLELGDLELLLAPLRSLAEVEGLDPDTDRYLGLLAKALEVRVVLELDRRSPVADFAQQLTELLLKLATAGGVVFSRDLFRVVRRLTNHGEAVACASAAPARVLNFPATERL